VKKGIGFIIWFLFLLLTIFILLSPKTFIGNDLNIDKIIHFLIFSILTALSLVVFVNLKKPYQILLVLLLIIFGFATENLQKFIPNRSFSYEDIKANFFGILAGFLIFKIFFKKK
jgi:VanZ family protein